MMFSRVHLKSDGVKMCRTQKMRRWDWLTEAQHEVTCLYCLHAVIGDLDMRLKLSEMAARIDGEIAAEG